MSAVSVPGLEVQLDEAKRNVFLLTIAQAIMGSAAPLSFSVGALAGYQLLGADKSLATAPLTGFNIGVALGAICVAAASRFLGRKAGFMVGALMCSIGGGIAAVALFRSDFWLFAVGLLLIGISGGFTQKFASPQPMPRHPSTSRRRSPGFWLAALFPPSSGRNSPSSAGFACAGYLAGAFLALVPLGLVSIAILAFLKLPDPKAATAHVESVRPLSEIVRTQRFVTGMICGIGSYALMTFMMTGAPLAMVIGCGFPTELATLGIQWHVLAMFGPSFFTGMLISRFGAEKSLRPASSC